MIHVAIFNDPVTFDTFFRWARLLGLHFAYQNHPQVFATVVTARPRFVWPCRVVALLARLHVWMRRSGRMIRRGVR
ncbi:MAG: hypothetical protein KDE20_15605 [Caldilineaceae bacterium]|nr:hypothetical protein [Caldilineaceae bacterium]